jgi:fructosamine-3-kinase
MHSVELKGFGRLSELASGGLPSWFDRVWQLLMIDIETCLERQLIAPQLAERAQNVIHRHRPLMDSVTRPVLVHSDAQFENWLTDGEKVTALLDFEWAHSGDPAWDFIVDHKWEDECPTSKAHVYRGYQSVRSLPDDFQLRHDLYNFVWRFTDLVWYDDSGEADHFADVMRQILELFEKLER